MDLVSHVNAVLNARHHDAVSRDASYNQLTVCWENLMFFNSARSSMPDQNISALPLSRNQFDLSAQEVRDDLVLWYKKPLTQISQSCDGHGNDFSTEHALSCRFGNLVVLYHNEV